MIIRTDGSLWGWGSNWSGQLGDSTTEMRNAPVHIMDDVASVVVAHSATYVICNDGILWAWGDNFFGQIGDGTHESRRSPVKIKENVVKVVSTATGFHADHDGDTVFAVTDDGGLYVWGAHSAHGIMGDRIPPQPLWIYDASRTAPLAYPSPVRIMNDVSQFTSNAYSAIAIRTDGSLWFWGNGNSVPTLFMENVVAAASASGGHHMAILADGSLWGWGNNARGQLGDGTTTFRSHPVFIMEDVANVALGANHTMAIRTDGSLWGWGDNRFGMLGIGTATITEPIFDEWGEWIIYEEIIEDHNEHSPVLIMDDVASVFPDGASTWAICQSGILWAWGANFSQRLGDGTNIDRHTPVQVFENAMLPPTRARVVLPFEDLAGTIALPDIVVPEPIVYEPVDESEEESGQEDLEQDVEREPISAPRPTPSPSPAPTLDPTFTPAPPYSGSSADSPSNAPNENVTRDWIIPTVIAVVMSGGLAVGFFIFLRRRRAKKMRL